MKMTDDPNPNIPPSDKNADEKAAHEALMEELFGDLPEETPDSIRAERDGLQQQVLGLNAGLARAQEEKEALTRQLAAQKEESAAVLARARKQAEEEKPFVLEKFVKEVLPVVDNLERGLAAIPADQRVSDPKFDKIAQGVEKTLQQLTIVFNKFGIKEINPAGEEFDPAKHEAIGMRDAPDAESDTVVEVAQKGYELNGRVIRPARVVVKP